MPRLLWMLVLLAGPTSADVNVEEVFADARTKYVGWSYACELTAQCVGLAAPKVVYKKMAFNLRGYYDGSDTVFISRDLRPGVDRMSTVIHEMIHYIHFQTGQASAKAPLGDSGAVRKMCWSEETAFGLTDAWLISKGHAKLVRGPDWWKPYWHCEPFYDPAFEPFDWFMRGAKRFFGFGG